MADSNFKVVKVSKDVVSVEVLIPSNLDPNFRIGTYVKIPYTNNDPGFIVAVVKNYQICSRLGDDPQAPILSPSFIVELELLGSINGDKKFERGSHGIPIPPNNEIAILDPCDLESVYTSRMNDFEQFTFSKLSHHGNVPVAVNGNKLFNKHFAIVGSTGSGKSFAVASIFQAAINARETGDSYSLNNTHVVLFDIHGEYKTAFPEANHIDMTQIKLPHWLLNTEEMMELYMENSEDTAHNQLSQFRLAVTGNKKHHNDAMPPDDIFFDAPLRFSIKEVINYLRNMDQELVSKKTLRPSVTGDLDERIPGYFAEQINFEPTDSKKGAFAGQFAKFVPRLESIANNPRLKFLFDDNLEASLLDVLKQLLGYNSKSNISVIDLSGVPFEVLSVTVSVVSRLIFEYGYYYRRSHDNGSLDAPVLLVYEEAHKYAPKSELTKYRASLHAIERIAKEGRKYGVTLAIVTQRPSEVSETIFAQCNSFIAMRLTNPADQNQVKRLLPDTLGALTNNLATLQSGEGLIAGEAISLPSLVKIDLPTNEPKSTDIAYYEVWKRPWLDVDFDSLVTTWTKS